MKKKSYKLGDIVLTKLGNLAVIRDITDNKTYDVNFIGKKQVPNDYNAWHPAKDLSYVDNFLELLCK